MKLLDNVNYKIKQRFHLKILNLNYEVYDVERGFLQNPMKLLSNKGNKI